jgi:hypothetical protein
MRSVSFVMATALLVCAACSTRETSPGEHDRAARPVWADSPKFTLYGFKAGVRPHSYWPVAAHFSVDRAKFRDVKAQQEKVRKIVDAALSGAEKEDILPSERGGRLEREIQDRTNELFEGSPVLDVDLWLCIK